MKRAVKLSVVAFTLLAGQYPVLAGDHTYHDDNAYFASKYHHRHPHHWTNNGRGAANRPAHWGRHHHHGIALDGNDGRP